MNDYLELSKTASSVSHWNHISNHQHEHYCVPLCQHRLILLCWCTIVYANALLTSTVIIACCFCVPSCQHKSDMLLLPIWFPSWHVLVPSSTHKSMLLLLAIAENMKLRNSRQDWDLGWARAPHTNWFAATTTYYDTAIMIDTFVVLAWFKLIVSSLFVHGYCQ